MTLSILFLAMALVSYSISQSQQHGRLRFNRNNKRFSFWGEDSDKRKYKIGTNEPAFFLSTTLLVWTTDGYHLMQFMFFNFLSLSVTLFMGFQWVTLGLVWGGIHIVHFLTYKLLSK